MFFVVAFTSAFFISAMKRGFIVRTKCFIVNCKNASCVKSHMRRDQYVFLFSTAVALVCKYITKGWKGVQEAYGDKEISDDLQKVFGYLEAVESLLSLYCF